MHVVSQGECCSSIAARYGLTNGRALYDHPDNAALKKARPNPNILAPGDEVVVPDPVQKWVSRPTEKKHRFVVPASPVKLRIFIRDWRGKGYEGKRFVVTVDDRKIEGTTGGAGLVEADIPAQALSGRLQVWLDDDDGIPDPHIDRPLAIGHLDPAEMISGAQARLANLGYACAVTGEIDEPTRAALRSFRFREGLPEVATGADDGGDEDGDPDVQEDEALLDDAVRARLSALHEGS